MPEPGLAGDRDHLTFLKLLDRHAAARQVEIHAYCLMSNHFHLIARGLLPDSICTFMRGLNGQYSLNTSTADSSAAAASGNPASTPAYSATPT